MNSKFDLEYVSIADYKPIRSKKIHLYTPFGRIQMVIHLVNHHPNFKINPHLIL